MPGSSTQTAAITAGTWPKSRDTIEAMVSRYDLTDEEAAAIFGGTLASIYGIELEAAA